MVTPNFEFTEEQIKLELDKDENFIFQTNMRLRITGDQNGVLSGKEHEFSNGELFHFYNIKWFSKELLLEMKKRNLINNNEYIDGLKVCKKNN